MPTTGMCLACLEQMAVPDPHSLSADDNLKWIQAHFDQHVRLKHRNDGQEDFSVGTENSTSHIN